MSLEYLRDLRTSTLVMELTQHLLEAHWRDGNGEPVYGLFPKLSRIGRQWLDGGYLQCEHGTVPAMLKYKTLASLACEKIQNAITRSESKHRPIHAVLEPYNPLGSTRQVSFNTTKPEVWEAAAHLSHVNYVVWDSTWEREFCRVVELHPRVHSYVKNQSLGFEVPYVFQGARRRYLPDFIVRLDDGHGPDDLLNLVVEIKGYRGEDAVAKKETMDVYWVPGVNNLGGHGRWAFHEFTEVLGLEQNFAALVQEKVTAELNLVIVARAAD
jgi:type III restriction enzyme